MNKSGNDAADSQRKYIEMVHILCEEVGLFHHDWYLARYPDVVFSADPVGDYLRRGGFEGRDPNPLFDSDWYLAKYSDVAAAALNPLAHYLTSGAREGRDPHPLFDSDWYLSQNPAVAGGSSPVAHFLSVGAREGCDPHPLFNVAWYLAQNRDVAAAGVNPLVHYLSSGALEGRDPSPFFDSDWYLKQNADVALAGINPLIHYVTAGALEGRNPSPTFDSAYYLWKYADAASSDLDPLTHFVTVGSRNGYRPHPSIDAPPDSKTLAVKHDSWRSPNGPEWVASFNRRLEERMTALKSMDLSIPFVGDAPTFSLTSTVYDTPHEFLKALAITIQAQAFKDFEWLILDNGCTAAPTIAMLAEIERSDARVKLFRVEENLHIIGGNRYLLERARGSYIVPIDSDDILYPDSLALFSNCLRCSNEDLPAIVYSDEQKVTSDGRPSELMWRWSYTFAHAMATVPAAHLMAFRASLALEVGVYSDDYARGSHDWDTALRLTERGLRAAHVPEVLYGWRMHEQSTAQAVDAKDYIGDSQSEVLRSSLKRRNLDRHFEIHKLFGGLGWYDLERKRFDAPAIEIIYVVGGSVADLRNLEHNLSVTSDIPGSRRVVYPSFRLKEIGAIRQRRSYLHADWIHYDEDGDMVRHVNDRNPALFARVIVSSNLRVAEGSSIWNAIGVLELDLRAGAVCGPILTPNGTMLNAGFLHGVGGGVGTPFYGWATDEIPGHLWRVMHRVAAAPICFVALREEALSAVGGICGIDVNDAIHGLEVARRLEEKGYTCVHTPKMRCERDELFVRFVGEGVAQGANIRSAELEFRRAPDFSGHLSRDPNRFGFLRRSSDDDNLPGVDWSNFAPAIPLNLTAEPGLAALPRLNVLLPIVRMSSMSGGPNTALNLAYRLALAGVPVRIVSTDLPPDGDIGPIKRHIMSLANTDVWLPTVEIVSGADRSTPLPIGVNDVFLATAWWTAQMAMNASNLVGGRAFLYLIQDFEPILYPASDYYAQALATYSDNFLPIFNTELLKGYFVEAFPADERFSTGLTFEPAISSDSFYWEHKDQGRRRRLLFYARPTAGARNLFQLGVAALRVAIAKGYLSPISWSFVGMGEQFEAVDLGYGAKLECAPWLGFEDYAQQMRQSDILLSLMLSPHPSYPPIEMAACGGIVITNSYANKTAERMAAISNNIIAPEPSIRSVSEALGQAVGRLDDVEGRQAAAKVAYPPAWDDSFSHVLPALVETLAQLGVAATPVDLSVASRAGDGEDATSPSLAGFLNEASKRRARSYAAEQKAGLLSLITPVWNTPPSFLDTLARSLRAQHGGTTFQWFILDNGSTRPDTRACLEELAGFDFVTLHRSEENLGIIGGTRYCLEHAAGRYIVPVDHDDLVFADAVQVITWHLEKWDLPPVLYSDETLLEGSKYLLPYLKPDWDPVLFVNSCYTAHLCAIDRAKALEFGAYSDRATEASPDWDLFTRFLNRGHSPQHIPAVLYGWRIHPQSTAGDINSKPYVFASQKAVLSRFLEAQRCRDHFDIQKSPLFGESPDWWFRRRRSHSRPITTILVTSHRSTRRPDLHLGVGVDHSVIEVDIDDSPTSLIPQVKRCLDEGRLVHVLCSDSQPDDDEWFWDAIGQLELFPDTVMVGGRIHSGATLLSAGLFFGFGEACDCPDKGRLLGDPGYFAQLWKHHSVSAVSAQHAVFQPDFLLDAIESIKAWSPSIAYLGAWCGAVARRRGRRVIYSPFVSAEASSDWHDQVSPTEKGRLASAFAEVMPERTLLSPDLGLTPATAYSPTNEADFDPASMVDLPTYQAWLGHRMLERASLYDAPLAGPSFSILTTVYRNTDAQLFALTAQSVLAQSYPNFQWCVLAHGPIWPALENSLLELERNPHVRVLRLPDNLGIIGGMRYAFDHSQGDYVIPLDGDDLLTIDCLQIFAATIAGSHLPPVFLYSDEDIIVEDRLSTPYLRPAWDPVLDVENSWIWHAVAFRRDVADNVGVYTDVGSEYCHDWDSVYRFCQAGFQPLHVPEVTYHWRHHRASTSNSGEASSGSSVSVRHLLSKKIADRGLTATCEVAPFPIYRGAEEWWVRRKPLYLPNIRVIALGAEPAGYKPVSEITEVASACVAVGDIDALRRAAATATNEALIMFASPSLRPEGSDWLTEAVKVFDFHDDVIAVSGRVLTDGRIVAAGLFADDEGRVLASYDGLSVEAAGHYALGWKPQCIAVPALDLCFVRAGWLKEALDELPVDCTFSEVAIWLGAFARQTKRRIAYSPLVSGSINRPPHRHADSRADTICWRHFLGEAADDRAGSSPIPRTAGRQGPTGYARARFAN